MTLPSGSGGRGRAAPVVTGGGAALRVVAAALLALTLPALGAPAGAAAQSEDPISTSPGFGQDGEVETGWSGSADLGFTLTEGNSETTNFSLAAMLNRRWERWRWTTDGFYLRATTDGEETANKGDLASQMDYFPHGRFFLFARMSGSFNDPAGLDLRLSPATGAGYQVFAGERVQMSVEGGVSWIRDAFASGPADEAVHATVGQDLAWVVAEDTRVQQSLLYEPKTSDLGDFLLTARASFTTMVTDALGLKVSFKDEYDSDPFDPAAGTEREKNDVTFVTGVTFQF